MTLNLLIKLAVLMTHGVLVNFYISKNNFGDLFEPRPPESVLISLKQTTKENYEKILQVCKKIGISEKITSILQPVTSAEINSQNFILNFESNKSLLLRRCCKFQGKERYQSLYNVLTMLRENGVRVPEFYSLISDGTVPYYEMDDTDQKVSWVFFKYIEAGRYFSGRKDELVDAGEQIGKMHACLKKHYDKRSVIPENTNRSENNHVPSLKSTELESYFKIIEKKLENGGDEYDKFFMESYELIHSMVTFVEENATVLQDINDMQNIHFDLNSSNFIINNDQQITIMDFDDLKLGNIYTDIGFAFHRLITTCIEQGQSEEKIPEIIQAFLTAYIKANPDVKFDVKKLIIATYNRALRNIKVNLALKYEQNSNDWLSSIPINIKRLKQVIFLTNIVENMHLD